MPKDRGAEQRDVDGPPECSLALGTVAVEARLRIAQQQAAGTLPWTGTHDQRTQKDFKTHSAAECIVSTSVNLEARKSSSEQMTHDIFHKKTEAWQTSGTLDDGDILCHPMLILPH